MRAKFVFEKFKEESDPIKDMNIGYKKKQLDSMSWKILEFIKSKGEEGAGLTEIQFYIWTELEGHDPIKFWEKIKEEVWDPIRSTKYGRNIYKTFYMRKTRGHWTTNLFSGPHYRGGLLNKFCKKNPETKKWVFVRFPTPGEIFYD